MLYTEKGIGLTEQTLQFPVSDQIIWVLKVGAFTFVFFTTAGPALTK